MKIGVLSRHSVANYGSLWQAYALQTILEKMGHEAVNINYTPAKEVGGTLASTLANISRWGKNPISKLLFLAYQYPSFSHTFETFKKFRKQYLKETNEYASSFQLKTNLPEVDLFCTGSDQVWNLLYDNKIDDTYFFDFLPNEKRRIAYAASFGGNDFACANIEKYASFLKKYDAISVREDSGVEILKTLGINGTQVLDPTLLLQKEEWESLLPNKEKKEDYLLIYQLRPNKAFDSYAVNLSKKTGIKLIRISSMFFQKFKVGKFHYLPKAEEFLWYIKNARCLLTDSFHGTCFAINFKTPFIEILPGRFNSRNQSLLKMVKLEKRILSNFDDFSLFEQYLDFNQVHEKLTLFRNNSIRILKEMIGA